MTSLPHNDIKEKLKSAFSKKLADLSFFSDKDLYKFLKKGKISFPFYLLFDYINKTKVDSEIIEQLQEIFNNIIEVIEDPIEHYCFLPVIPPEIIESLSNHLEFRIIKNKLQDLKEEKDNILEDFFQNKPVNSNQNLPNIAFPIYIYDASDSIVFGDIETDIIEIDNKDNTETNLKKEQIKLLISSFQDEYLDNKTKLYIKSKIIDDYNLDIKGSTSWSLAAWITSYIKCNNYKLAKNILATGCLTPIANTNDFKITRVCKVVEKIKAGLSSGFNIVIVPKENKKELEEYFSEERLKKLESNNIIKFFNNTKELRDWIRENDVNKSSLWAMESFLKGTISEKLLNKKTQRQSIEAFLEKSIDDYLIEERNLLLKNICYKNPDSLNRLNNWKRYIEILKEALYHHLENYNSYKKESVINTFLFLVPDSVKELHLPSFLQYLSEIDIQHAKKIYDKLDYRLIDQDMNRHLALNWGKMLFNEKNTLFKSNIFRKRFPILRWFAFSDALEALENISNWEKISDDEKEWINLLLKVLKEELFREKTSEFATSSSWENASQTALQKLADIYLTNYIPRQSVFTQLNDIKYKLQTISKSSENYNNHEEEINVLISLTNESSNSKPKEYFCNNWIKFLLDNDNSDFVINKIGNNIKNIISVSFDNIDETDFSLLCLINPALSIAIPLIKNKDRFIEISQLWLKEIQHFSDKDFEIRNKSTKLLLHFYLGKVIARISLDFKQIVDYLESNKINPLAFLIGYNLLSENKDNIVKEKIIKYVEKVLKNNQYEYLVFLYFLKYDSEINQKIKFYFCKQIETFDYQISDKICKKQLKTVLKSIILISIWPSLKKELPLSLKIANEIVLDNFKRNPKLNDNELRSYQQAILPFWFINKKIRINLSTVLNNKGFNPIVYNMIIKEIKKHKNSSQIAYLKKWHISWEQQIYFTLLLIDSYLCNNKRTIRKIFMHQDLDLPNSFLALKMLDVINNKTYRTNHNNHNPKIFS